MCEIDSWSVCISRTYHLRWSWSRRPYALYSKMRSEIACCKWKRSNIDTNKLSDIFMTLSRREAERTAASICMRAVCIRARVHRQSACIYFVFWVERAREERRENPARRSLSAPSQREKSLQCNSRLIKERFESYRRRERLEMSVCVLPLAFSGKPLCIATVSIRARIKNTSKCKRRDGPNDSVVLQLQWDKTDVSNSRLTRVVVLFFFHSLKILTRTRIGVVKNRIALKV